jgi:septal ring factor EnvC (AmiA/AmiB activator)
VSTVWILIALSAAALVAGGLCWLGCAWWYGQRLDELRSKLAKSREQASTYLQQARQQIVQLQRDLDSARRAAGELREELSHHIARANAEAALEARASDRVAVRGVPVSRPMPLTHGFAETQPYTGTNG